MLSIICCLSIISTPFLQRTGAKLRKKSETEKKSTEKFGSKRKMPIFASSKQLF
jgi:hypothetical protein